MNKSDKSRALSNNNRTRWGTVLLVALASFIAVAASSQQSKASTTLRLHVQNTHGTPQPSVFVYSDWEPSELLGKTDIRGDLSLPDSYGYLVFSRRPLGIDADEPECKDRVQDGLVLEDHADPVVITMQARIADQPGGDGLDDDARGIVGRMNEDRAAYGLDPLQISTVLSDQADRYSNYLSDRGGYVDTCALSAIDVRTKDLGYPGDDAAEEVISPYGGVGDGSSGTEAVTVYQSLQGHHLDPGYQAVGVGHKNGVWDFVYDPGCDSSVSSVYFGQCGMTADTGDPELFPEDDWQEETEPEEPDTEAADRRRALRVAKKKCKKKYRKRPAARKKCIKREKRRIKLEYANQGTVDDWVESGPGE